MIFNVFLIAVTIAALFASLKLFSMAAGTISPLKLNTISYVLYFQVLTVGVVGPLLLALDLLNYHPMIQQISYHTKFMAWVWCMYALVALPLSMNVYNIVFKIKMPSELTQYSQETIPEKYLTHNRLFSTSFVLISLFGLLYIFYYTSSIPIVKLLTTGDLAQAAIERINSRRAFLGIPYIRSFVGIYLIPAGAYYLYILAYNKRTIRAWFLFACQLLLTILLLTYDLQKAPIAFFILGFLVVHTFISNGISRKWFLIVFGSSVLFILLGYQLTTETTILRQITNVQSAFFGRIFLVSYFGFPLSLEFYPDSIHAATALYGVPGPILDILNLEGHDSARELMIHMYSSNVDQGSANLISSYYLAEAWSAFGYVGLVLAPFIVGGVIQLTHVLLIKLPKDPLFIAFYALITTKWLVLSGFSPFLTMKILFPMIVAATLYFFRNTLIRSK
tara:strand:- start:3582 stop:4925 length:1344 start_codon:yes stop_codon:yes gene_type:complete